MLDAIGVMGSNRCAYNWGERDADDWAHKLRCDCKYGGETFRRGALAGGEQTGCPELRLVYLILEALTDEEWETLGERAGAHIITAENLQAALNTKWPEAPEPA